MNENQTSDDNDSAKTVRPTKKQRELLGFIDEFIREHGYSPSYREIMTGLSYTSVATVALHVSNLIKRGHLRKREHSARSLEVVNPEEMQATGDEQAADHEAQWLVYRIEKMLQDAENTEFEDEKAAKSALKDIEKLAAALHVLGLTEAAEDFVSRITLLKQGQNADEAV